MSIKDELDKVTALRIAYAELFTGDEDLLLDALEGQTNILECVDWILDKLSNAEALEEALAIQIKSMGERKARFQVQQERFRALLNTCLTLTTLDKIERPRATVSLRQTPPKVIVTDEAILPEDYVRVKREPDKVAIGAALKSGMEVAGATLGNGGQTITVKFT